MKLLELTFAAKIAVTALVLTTAGTCLFGAGSAYALSLGTNITKNDGVGTGGIGIGREDNEAEPGMIQSQAWDLEGFFLNGKKLSIVGGYNFYAGQMSGGKNYRAGDIFIDTNGDAVYSPGSIAGGPYSSEQNVKNGLFNYDYVLDIDWVAGTFNIVELDSNSYLKLGYYGSTYNLPSNPWEYVSGGSIIGSGLNITQTNGGGTYTDLATGFSGWDTPDRHYVASFDLSAVTFGSGPSGTIFHNTMECGNDNLIGQAAPVPEPGTMMLLSFGMLCLTVYGKRRMNKEV